MTFKEYYKDMVDRGIISTELQGQRDIETYHEIQLQKARDKADQILDTMRRQYEQFRANQILSLWKIVAQSVPLLVDDNPMQYDKLPDYDILCFFGPLIKFGKIGGN